MPTPSITPTVTPAITLKLGELVKAKPALEKLLQQKFSITTAYKLARRLRIINEALMTFDAKRGELVKELGTPVADNPGKIQLRQVTPDTISKAKDEVLSKRAKANQAVQLHATAGNDTEKATAKTTMDTLVKLADDAETEIPALEKEMASWNEFVTKTNELMMVDEVLPIDPIKLSELQPPENIICSKCGRSSNEITVDDVMLLFPLLAEECDL
jgi:hypothetical protein